MEKKIKENGISFLAFGFKKKVYFWTVEGLEHFFFLPLRQQVNDSSGSTKNEMKSVVWYGAGLLWQSDESMQGFFSTSNIHAVNQWPSLRK